jgi:hypothetical protein
MSSRVLMPKFSDMLIGICHPDREKNKKYFIENLSEITGKNKKSAVRGERTGRRKGGWMSVVNQVVIPVHDLFFSNCYANLLSICFY